MTGQEFVGGVLRSLEGTWVVAVVIVGLIVLAGVVAALHEVSR